MLQIVKIKFNQHFVYQGKINNIDAIPGNFSTLTSNTISKIPENPNHAR